MDVTSLKEAPVQAMLASTPASVVGTHPMFGPSVHTLQGQRVVLCRARGDAWGDWVAQSFAARGLVVTESTASQHDRAMSVVQVLTHFQTQVQGLTLSRLGVPLADTMPFTSPAALPTSVRAIDAMLTIGKGQRMGIFAGPGVGKSTLLGSIARGTSAHINVIGLIGERGREVPEFLEHVLGAEGLQRSIVVVATGDESPLMRVRAATVACSAAEYFRDQGLDVMLMLDSVTRFARALREIGLSAGEPPARQGFPPSVFATLPKLMERVGMNDRGSITALYTVLVEGDDMTEPIADETRSILDGHIILSRNLAAANHYPAIDILASTSRVQNAVVSREHRAAAGRLRELMAKYAEVELLVKIGEYKRGGDPTTDEAIDKIEVIREFLKQRTEDRSPFASAQAGLSKLTGLQIPATEVGAG
jgi:type III secretion protein N (ATPase)